MHPACKLFSRPSRFLSKKFNCESGWLSDSFNRIKDGLDISRKAKMVPKSVSAEILFVPLLRQHQ
jgi:hypothetical protein